MMVSAVETRNWSWIRQALLAWDDTVAVQQADLAALDAVQIGEQKKSKQ